MTDSNRIDQDTQNLLCSRCCFPSVSIKGVRLAERLVGDITRLSKMVAPEHLPKAMAIQQSAADELHRFGEELPSSPEEFLGADNAGLLSGDGDVGD